MTQTAWEAAGVQISRTSQPQSRDGSPVAISDFPSWRHRLLLQRHRTQRRRQRSHDPHAAAGQIGRALQD
ncbi:hypothetical protein ACMYYO_10400 [Dermacoccaceae bacterium W4C1]